MRPPLYQSGGEDASVRHGLTVEGPDSDSTANPYDNCSGVMMAWGVIAVRQLETMDFAVGHVRLA
jgi:hypothetical protein